MVLPVPLPRAVIIHSLGDAKAALAPGLPVLFISAPGAVNYAGCLWWQALLRESGITGLSFLDCADAAGRAAEALQLGLPGIIFTGGAVLQRAVAGIADQTGAILLAKAPPALDMAAKAARYHLATWLAG